MIKINDTLTPSEFRSGIKSFWNLSGEKILSIQRHYHPDKGAPVFSVNGKYTSKGWTEWTQGFQYGSAILQFDATGDEEFLKIGRDNTVGRMASHISHTGVHDHGFNNLSTYGNLLRLMMESKIPENTWEKNFYQLALKLSGAVQAGRWTPIPGGGFIHSFNGPHSLFVDTIRTIRILMISHLLGHKLQSENDIEINLFDRALQHAKTTADYSIFYGKGRDAYDVRGRTAHEAIFNVHDGNFRCPNAQQGYSGFTTWTRGLAWAICGFAEEIELLNVLPESAFSESFTKKESLKFMLDAATAVCDFYIENTPTDGIPYWDTGAPNLHKINKYLDKPSDPFNDYEPVDSSAAAIAAQGFLRLGKFLEKQNPQEAKKYWQSGLTIFKSLLDPPYLSDHPEHQGLLLHSIYHAPNGWDNIPEGSRIANGESSMWGDYHIRELVLYVQRLINNEPYYTFFGCIE